MNEKHGGYDLFKGRPLMVASMHKTTLILSFYSSVYIPKL